MNYTRKTVEKWKYDAWRLGVAVVVASVLIGRVAMAVEAKMAGPLITPLADVNREYIEKTIYVTPATIEDKIRARFGQEADVALRVAFCESSMNPRAKNSTSSARGLFQIMQSWHRINEKWLFNEDVNIEVAYQLWTEQGWTPWEASRHCWEK